MSKNFDSPIEIGFCGATPMPRIIGGPVQFSDPDYTERCPLCLAKLADEDHGYGFAFGGGIGSYITCPEDGCEWFVKEIDDDPS